MLTARQAFTLTSEPPLEFDTISACPASSRHRAGMDGFNSLGDPGPLMMASRSMGFMFVWYGMLWSVIEATVRIR